MDTRKHTPLRSPGPFPDIVRGMVTRKHALRCPGPFPDIVRGVVTRKHRHDPSTAGRRRCSAPVGAPLPRKYPVVELSHGAQRRDLTPSTPKCRVGGWLKETSCWEGEKERKGATRAHQHGRARARSRERARHSTREAQTRNLCRGAVTGHESGTLHVWSSAHLLNIMRECSLSRSRRRASTRPRCGARRSRIRY